MNLGCAVRGAVAVEAKLQSIRDQIGDVFANPAPIQAIVAETILARMDQELDPDGIPWHELSPGYAAWKAKHAPGSEMGRLDGLMKDIPNLMGRAVGAGTATLIVAYGVDPVAIVHAIKFTEGGAVTGTNQPPRPFWALNDESLRRLDDHFHTLIVV